MLGVACRFCCCLHLRPPSIHIVKKLHGPPSEGKGDTVAWSWSASAVLVAFSVPAPSLRPRQSHDGLDRLNFLPLSPPPLVIVWFLPEKMSFASSNEQPSKVNKTGSSISGLSLRQALIEGRAEEEPRWLLDSRGVGGGGSSLLPPPAFLGQPRPPLPLPRQCSRRKYSPLPFLLRSWSTGKREGGGLSWAGEKVLWGGERRGRQRGEGTEDIEGKGEKAMLQRSRKGKRKVVSSEGERAGKCRVAIRSEEGKPQTRPRREKVHS